MKKVFSFWLLLIIIGINGSAQSVRIALTGGYCLPIASAQRTTNAIQFQNTGYPNYYYSYQKVRPNSYGSGGNVALGVSWFSKVNIGLGLKLNALFSSPISSSTRTHYLGGIVADYKYIDRSTSFQFIPHLCFKHDFKKISPVIEFGPLVGIINVKTNSTATANNGDVVLSRMKLYGNLMVGFYSSLGAVFKVSEVISLSFGINCTAGTYSPSKWKVTSFTVNNRNYLQNLTVSEKEGVFVKEVDHTASQPSNQPNKDLKFTLPFSNVGINAGVSLVLAKKKQQVATPEEEKEF